MLKKCLLRIGRNSCPSFIPFNICMPDPEHQFTHCDTSCFVNMRENNNTEHTIKEDMLQLMVLTLKQRHQLFTSPCVSAALTFALLNKRMNRLFFSPQRCNHLKCTEICAVWQQCYTSIYQIPSNLFLPQWNPTSLWGIIPRKVTFSLQHLNHGECQGGKALVDDLKMPLNNSLLLHPAWAGKKKISTDAKRIIFRRASPWSTCWEPPKRGGGGPLDVEYELATVTHKTESERKNWPIFKVTFCSFQNKYGRK